MCGPWNEVFTLTHIEEFLKSEDLVTKLLASLEVVSRPLFKSSPGYTINTIWTWSQNHLLTLFVGDGSATPYSSPHASDAEQDLVTSHMFFLSHFVLNKNIAPRPLFKSSPGHKINQPKLFASVSLFYSVFIVPSSNLLPKQVMSHARSAWWLCTSVYARRSW